MVVALVVGAVVVQHERRDRGASQRAEASQRAQVLADLVRAGLARATRVTASPSPSLAWSRRARSAGGTAGVAAGRVAFTSRSRAGDLVAFRVQRAPRGDAPADPCEARGALPLTTGPAGRLGCDTRRELAGGDELVVRTQRRVLGEHYAEIGRTPTLQQVHEAVLVAGRTTYSVAVSWRVLTNASAAAQRPPVADAALTLATRYVAAAWAHGPGVAATRVLARAAVTTRLALLAPQLYPPSWTSSAATSAASASTVVHGRRSVDLEETTALLGVDAPPGTQVGYRVVRAAGSAETSPRDVCGLAAVLSALPGTDCRAVRSAAGGPAVATTQRQLPSGAQRQVTVLVRAAAPARWASVAVVGPAGSHLAQVPLSTADLLSLARALAATDPP